VLNLEFRISIRDNVSKKTDSPHMERFYWFFLIIVAISVAVSSPPAMGEEKGHKVALVLSGGGARGAAHIGVLRVFERAHIPIHCIVGTSFGALVGGLYSVGYSPDDLERILSGQDWNLIFSDAPQRRLTPIIERRNSRYQGQISFSGWTPELPTGLSGGQRLTERLDILTTSRMLSAGFDFDKLRVQFRAVATDLVNGQAYIFKQGPLTEALRASMGIPLLFSPLEKDGILLVDGGLVDNLPTDIARRLGADIVIAVDATSPLQTKDMIRNFVNVADQAISLPMVKDVMENRKLATVVLQPQLDDYSNMDYDKIHKIVSRGEEEANRLLGQIEFLVRDVAPPRPLPQPPSTISTIESVSFRGLKRIKAEQLLANVHFHHGERVDPSAIGADVGRLYATRLFDSVSYALEPLGANRYDLVFTVNESPVNALGAGLRYDNDFKFVALAEFTARQLFNTPSNLTISSQFGGLEDHVASLHLVPPHVPVLFFETRGEAVRLERLDIRDKEIVDRFTDKREIATLMIGGSFSKQQEIAVGFRIGRVRIDQGMDPNRLAGSLRLAGLTFRLNRDSLDTRLFPSSGMALRAQVEQSSKSLGGDLNYSRWEAELQNYFSRGKSTLKITGLIGHSRGSVPFFDQFFVGGYSFSQIASKQFLGLERDELAVHQVAVVSGSYRRLLFSRPLSVIKRGFVTATYNGVFYSDRTSLPYNFDFMNGAGLGLGLDTMLGPVRIAGGWAEGKRVNFYITFGPSF
jgi:NTE family protein